MVESMIIDAGKIPRGFGIGLIVIGLFFDLYKRIWKDIDNNLLEY